MAEFVHLHVHSEYSMLDGAIRIADLVSRVGEMGMGAVALTDNANMFGAVQLHKICSKGSVRPILGCEVNITAGRRDDSRQEAQHLVLLAASQEGYHNVVRLVSRAWVEGLHLGVPRIDLQLLEEHREGLVGLTGCMGGLLPQRVLVEGPEAGRALLGQLRDLFEPGHLFVELQDHGFPETRPLNAALVELARDLQVPLVATNDCHYPDREAAQAHLVLQCIGTGRQLREMRELHHQSSEMYLKSAEQMVELFRHTPEAISNTMRIAEMCAGQANPLSPPQLPRFRVEEGETEAKCLRRLAAEGLDSRLASKRAIAERAAAERVAAIEERAASAEEDESHLSSNNLPSNSNGASHRLSDASAAGANASVPAEPYDEALYRERLQMELDVIERMGFPGYFLIVQDFINWAKNHGVPVGPGRGSGAGSLVAWSLRITDLDPIPYGLLFERFLNPERVSMPDFDIDFCMDKRDQVIDYVRQKYGQASVGQIATFHQLKSKSCVRDVGRVMGMSPADAGRIASLIPELGPGKSAPIAKALETTPRLKELYDGSEGVRELLDTADKLENLTRHAGMHAAGVVISEGPIWDYVPVFCPEDGVFVTQYHKDDVEAAGLVKFDFLGLRTLTVIDIAKRLIDRRPDRTEPLELDAIPMDDEATFALLRSGETTNVFQLESSGMQSLFKQLKPTDFEDIVAAVALYRPGPMGAGMDRDFVERKHGRQRVTYPDPSLEKILEPTRGVIVYQEQVMQIAREMAGYSLGDADLLRRAMGKKKPEEMAKQKEIFIAGATAKGFTRAKAEEVFDLMAFFAGYGFNKSHSAAYALIAYQTAYLKTHFPVEFVCATLSADKDKVEKVVRTVTEARAMGITVLPPDVNESDVDFTVVYADEPDRSKRPRRARPVCLRGELNDPWEPKIRFGLGAIKGVGSSALEAILEIRKGAGEGKEQPFGDLFDLCERVDLRRVNKSVTEALVQSGAFDSMHERVGVHRASALASVAAAFERGRKIATERESGQTSLFGLLGDDEPVIKTAAGQFADAESWDLRELLQREKAALGFYLSGHPLDRFATELARLGDATSETLSQLKNGTEVKVGGSVEGYRERRTKMGGDMAFFSLEDPHGRVEVIVRPRNLEAPGLREVLGSGEPVLVEGRVKHEVERGAEGEDAPVETKILLDRAILLSDALSKETRSIALRLSVERLERSQLESLRQALGNHPGPCPVALELVHDEWVASFSELGPTVAPSEGLKASVERLFGPASCRFV